MEIMNQENLHKYPFNLNEKQYKKIVNNLIIYVKNVKLFIFYYQNDIPYYVGGVWFGRRGYG